MALCSICPRRCGAERTAGAGGVCRSPALPVVARAAPHYWEEPCVSGSRGSGAVFFKGCNLRCVFCQNREISRSGAGKELSVPELRDVFLRLRDDGVHNINLVTGTQYTPTIAEALAGISLGIPVVWNSSGYESVDTLRQLEGLVQVYLPDLKYSVSETARKYSAAPDYPEVAGAAIGEMFRQTGAYELDRDDIIIRGVIVRHLVLPGNIENTYGVIDWVAERFQPGDVLFSLMGQYTPMPGLSGFPELSRALTPEEYDAALHYLSVSGVEDGYTQELSSAGEDYIPGFDES